jgi:hypothetical protein
MIEEVFKTPVGIIILSILWGLGLSTLFHKACQGRKCTVIRYEGPDPEQLRGQFYNYGGPNCYQYQPVLSPCSS